VFAHGGFLVDPYFITQIVDRDGKPVFVADRLRACRNCEARLLQNPDVVDSVGEQHPAEATTAALPDALVPVAAGSTAAPAAPRPPRLAPRAIDVRTDYLITSMMLDVIRRGTGSAAMALKRDDLAGKTGSTNDHRDAWFSGFDTGLVATVWVGFDDFSSLGRGEFCAKAALPIWMAYMGAALQGVPSGVLPMPPGIATVTINRSSGLPTSAGDPDAMPEFFKVEDVSRLRAMAKQQDADKDKQHAYDIF
jgi:penicillin-binding protein 1A